MPTEPFNPKVPRISDEDKARLAQDAFGDLDDVVGPKAVVVAAAEAAPEQVVPEEAVASDETPALVSKDLVTELAAEAAIQDEIAQEPVLLTAEQDGLSKAVLAIDEHLAKTEPAASAEEPAAQEAPAPTSAAVNLRALLNTVNAASSKPMEGRRLGQTKPAEPAEAAPEPATRPIDTGDGMAGYAAPKFDVVSPAANEVADVAEAEEKTIAQEPAAPTDAPQKGSKELLKELLASSEPAATDAGQPAPIATEAPSRTETPAPERWWSKVEFIRRLRFIPVETGYIVARQSEEGDKKLERIDRKRFDVSLPPAAKEWLTKEEKRADGTLIQMADKQAAIHRFGFRVYTYLYQRARNIPPKEVTDKDGWSMLPIGYPKSKRYEGANDVEFLTRVLLPAAQQEAYQKGIRTEINPDDPATQAWMKQQLLALTARTIHDGLSDEKITWAGQDPLKQLFELLKPDVIRRQEHKRSRQVADRAARERAAAAQPAAASEPAGNKSADTAQPKGAGTETYDDEIFGDLMGGATAATSAKVEPTATETKPADRSAASVKELDALRDRAGLGEKEGGDTPLSARERLDVIRAQMQEQLDRKKTATSELEQLIPDPEQRKMVEKGHGIETQMEKGMLSGNEARFEKLLVPWLISRHGKDASLVKVEKLLVSAAEPEEQEALRELMRQLADADAHPQDLGAKSN